MKLIGFVLSILLLSAACSKPPERALVVDKLKSASKLATVEYVVTKMIVGTKKKELWGIKLSKDAKFMAKTQAFIKAGIDLEKLREDDIKIKDYKINLLLPPIEIINFSYPPDAFKTVKKYTQGNYWNSFSLADKDVLYRRGESAIWESIDKLGITKSAETNTRKLLIQLLENMGFGEIYINFRESKIENR